MGYDGKCTKILCPRQHTSVVEDCNVEGCPWRTAPPVDVLAENLKRYKADNMSAEFIHGYETAMREIDGKYIPITWLRRLEMMGFDYMHCAGVIMELWKKERMAR